MTTRRVTISRRVKSMNVFDLAAILERDGIPIRSVSGLERFPCATFQDFRASLANGQIKLFTKFDADVFELLSNRQQLTTSLVVSWIPAVIALASIVLAFVYWNFWLLIGIPLSFFGLMTATPGVMRAFGSLLWLVALVYMLYALFVGATTTGFLAASYVLSNYSSVVVRNMCDARLRRAAEESETVFVWMYLRGTVAVMPGNEVL